MIGRGARELLQKEGRGKKTLVQGRGKKGKNREGNIGRHKWCEWVRKRVLRGREAKRVCVGL